MLFARLTKEKWLWLWMVTVIAVAVTAAVLWPRGHLYGQDFDSRLDRFQTLIGGIWALVGGIYAVIGLANQIRISERQHAELMKEQRLAREQAGIQYQNEVKAQTDLRHNEQTARAATLAQQMAIACESVLVVLREILQLVDYVKTGQSYSTVIQEDLHNRYYPELLEAAASFEEASRWARDPLLLVPPKNQNNLTRQIAHSYADVSNIKRLIKDCQVVEGFLASDLPLPPDSVVRDLRESLAQLAICCGILGAISKEDGVTGSAVVSTMVLQQTQDRDAAIKAREERAKSLR